MIHFDFIADLGFCCSQNIWPDCTWLHCH